MQLIIELFSVIAMNIHLPTEVFQTDPSTPLILIIFCLGPPWWSRVCLPCSSRLPLTVIKKNDTSSGSRSTPICRNSLKGGRYVARQNEFPHTCSRSTHRVINHGGLLFDSWESEHSLFERLGHLQIYFKLLLKKGSCKWFDFDC